jgi:hypothetical protein
VTTTKRRAPPLLPWPAWPARLVFLAALWAAPAAPAAETEPHYGWRHPPRDGTARLNAAIRARIDAALQDVNRDPHAATRACADVAVAATARLSSTAGWYFLGATRSFGLDTRPQSATEYVEEFLPVSIYRHARLWPFGQAVPVDPSIRVGDVVFGTDKIAHFFTNGARAFARFTEERAHGAGVVDAVHRALEDGVAEERSFLGQWASGIFSFADLEANAAGLRFYRSLCEDGGLQKDIHGRWSIAPFDIARWVTPCFDEAFEPSAFADGDRDAIRRALGQLCPRWRRDDVQERWQRLRRRGCDGGTHAFVHGLVARGLAPDPTPFDIARVCAPPPTASARTASEPGTGTRQRRLRRRRSQPLHGDGAGKTSLPDPEGRGPSGSAVRGRGSRR